MQPCNLHQNDLPQKQDQVDSNWIRISFKEKQSPSSLINPTTNTHDEPLYQYPMSRRGRCLILNYKQFTIFEKPRHGTQHDVKALKKTFGSLLGFEIVEHHNLSLSDTKRVLTFGY